MANDETKTEQNGSASVDESEATGLIDIDGKKYTQDQLVENFKKLSKTVGAQGNKVGHQRKFMDAVAAKVPGIAEIVKLAEENPQEAIAKLAEAVNQAPQMSEDTIKRIQNNETIFSEWFAQNPEVVKLYGKDNIRFLAETKYKETLNKSEDAYEALNTLFRLPAKEDTQTEEENTGSTVTVTSGKRSTSTSAAAATGKSDDTKKFDPIEQFRKNSIYK